MPGASFVAVAVDMAFIVWLALIALILLWTPSGRRPDGPWGWVAPAAIAGAGVVLMTGFFSEYELDPPYEGVTSPLAIVRDTPPVSRSAVLGLVAVHVAVVGAGASLVARFRRASGDERLQLRWVAAAAVPLVVLVLVALVVATLDGPTILLAIVAGLFLAVFPVAAGLAIVRYHLFDVDRLVSRAISYVLLTGVVVLTFLTVVLLLGATLGRVAGRSQSAAVVATLAAVTVAWPAACARCRRLVDRRFNRRALRRRPGAAGATSPTGAGLDGGGGAAVRDGRSDARGRLLDRRTARCWVAQDGRPVPADARRRGRPTARDRDRPGGVRRERGAARSSSTRSSPRRGRSWRTRGCAPRSTLQLVEVRESRARIVAAQLAERRTDRAQPARRRAAAAARARDPAAGGRGERRADASARAALRPAAVEQLQAAVVELRDLANGLHPAASATAGWRRRWTIWPRRIPVPVRLDATGERFAPEVEETAWFIACEAVDERGQARRPATLDITAPRRDGCARSSIVDDDGVGGADPAGSGLRGIADRAEAAGGTAARRRDRRGGGTVVDRGAAVRVVIADDSVLLREGLARLLAEAGIEVVAQRRRRRRAGGGGRATPARPGARRHPHAADLHPRRRAGGHPAAGRLRPTLGILLLSQSIESRYALELAREHPARFGYLLKDRVLDVATLIDAVERVAGGGTVLDPDIVAPLPRAGTARATAWPR